MALGYRGAWGVSLTVVGLMLGGCSSQGQSAVLGPAPAVSSAAMATEAPPLSSSSAPLAAPGEQAQIDDASTAPDELPPPALSSLAFEQGTASYYAPHARASDGPWPLTVYLHGMCANGLLECPVFSSASEAGWLLCPDGNNPCQGSGFMWSGGPVGMTRKLDQAVTSLRAEAGERLASAPMALIGYSLGGAAALGVLLHQPGRFDRLMIVNSSGTPSIAQLKSAGVRRMALVAGERDATASKLRAAARQFAHSEIEVAFFSLDATGHYFDAATEERLAPAMRWLLRPLKDEGATRAAP